MTYQDLSSSKIKCLCAGAVEHEAIVKTCFSDIEWREMELYEKRSYLNAYLNFLKMKEIFGEWH